MIPELITKTDIVEALGRIVRDGIPSRRRARGYCLVADGKHFPPKYTIALAHQVATGESLNPNQFSGGVESNHFLRRRGFNVFSCDCGGSGHDHRAASVSAPSEGKRPASASTRHSERCRACKTRVRELLERIYGTCQPNRRLRWQTSLAAYEGTLIEPALRNVAEALATYRGFSSGEYVRSGVLAPCDFWVPHPGFIVEFDESQHFTSPRRLALCAYANEHPLGFSPQHWIALCAHHDAKDNDPPFRDEQRAWYDTLRDLVPLLEDLQPTVRLYARALAWCSLDPDSSHDQDRFSDLIRGGNLPSTRKRRAMRSNAARKASTLRVAMVFPEVDRSAAEGIPPSGPGAQQPVVPVAASFASEAVDFVLFPEGYICASDGKRIRALNQLASNLRAPLLVGAIDRSVDASGRDWQVLLRFEPDGSRPFRVYTKHSSAAAVAFESPIWEPDDMLPTFELGGEQAGATICHDHYLGLLPRHLAKRGVRLWVNPSFENVIDIKWSSVLRLRAVENRFFALCTLHCDVNKRTRTHPFAFSPHGNELMARQAGSEDVRPVSECNEAGKVYIVDLDMTEAGKPRDWSKLPPAKKPKSPRNGQLRKPVRVALRRGKPVVLGRSGWKTVHTGDRVETDHGPVCVGVVPGDQILNAAECFRVVDHAKHMECAPIIWNQWKRLPVDSDRLASLMMGRAIECCAPIVISDRDGICELVELTNRNKYPARRTMEASGEWIVDTEYAWGLKSAFKMVASNLPRDMRVRALDRYRRLG